MKNLSILLLSLGILLTSCGDDFNEEVVGIYFLKTTTISNCDTASDTIIDADENGCVTALTGETTCSQLIINNDGTARMEASVNGTMQTSQFTYVLDSSTNTITLCDKTDCTDMVHENGQLTQVERLLDCDMTLIFE